MRKLGEGAADGLVLAKAGLKRLGRDCVPHEVLTEDIIVPAPGQGALAVEARLDRKDVMELLSAADHGPTRLEVECERAFLRLMGGGCRTPLGAWARTKNNSLDFLWFWSDDSGKHPERGSFTCPADLVLHKTSRGIGPSVARQIIMIHISASFSGAPMRRGRPPSAGESHGAGHEARGAHDDAALPAGVVRVVRVGTDAHEALAQIVAGRDRVGRRLHGKYRGESEVPLPREPVLLPEDLAHRAARVHLVLARSATRAPAS